MSCATGKENAAPCYIRVYQDVMAAVQYYYFAISMEGSLAGENMPFSIVSVQILVYNVMYLM